MFKYIAKQLEPDNEDFGFVFDDDGLNPSSGDFNNTLFIFKGNDCRFNDDIYILIMNPTSIIWWMIYMITSMMGIMIMPRRILLQIILTMLKNLGSIQIMPQF